MLIGTRRGDLGGRSIKPCCNTDSVPAIGLEGPEEEDEKIAEERGSLSICLGSCSGLHLRTWRLCSPYVQHLHDMPVLAACAYV